MSKSLFPPGPRIGRLDGLRLATQRRDILEFLTTTAREFGDISHFKVGSRRIYLLNHPDYIRDSLTRYYESFAKGRRRQGKNSHFLGNGLLTSEGDFHRRQRQSIQPAFHKSQFAAHEEVIIENAVGLRERWRHGEQVDIMRDMKQVSLEIISKMVFDSKTEAEADEIAEAIELVLSQFSPFGSPLGKLTASLPMSRARRIRKAQARLDQIVRRLISKRRQDSEPHSDLLEMLVSVVSETGSGSQMDDQQVRDEAMTFFLAGIETMGTALGWTWHLLAKNPQVQAKLHAELDSALSSRLPTMADLPKLPYTKMVFAEAMRIYPPGWVVARYLVEDFATGDYVLPAGSTVIISQYLMHRDPRFFPDPLRFDPLRWTPEMIARRPRYSYFPFGGGPRVCVGEGLSWAQGTLLIATLGQQWQMRALDSGEPELNARITLGPKQKILLQLERRVKHSHPQPAETERFIDTGEFAVQGCPMHQGQAG